MPTDDDTLDRIAQAMRNGARLIGADARPPSRLRDYLRVARDVGLDFDPAWDAGLELALEDLHCHYPGDSRAAWAKALRATRKAWRRAYDLEPDPLAAFDVDALLNGVEA
jgi:hypothetical protein